MAGGCNDCRLLLLSFCAEFLRGLEGKPCLVGGRKKWLNDTGQFNHLNIGMFPFEISQYSTWPSAAAAQEGCSSPIDTISYLLAPWRCLRYLRASQFQTPLVTLLKH